MTPQGAPTPRGWYLDPQIPGYERFWNGVSWTEANRPIERRSQIPGYLAMLACFGLGIVFLGMIWVMTGDNGSEPTVAAASSSTTTTEATTTTTESTTSTTGRQSMATLETTPIETTSDASLFRLTAVENGWTGAWLLDDDAVTEFATSICEDAGDIEGTNDLAFILAVVWERMDDADRGLYDNGVTDLAVAYGAAVATHCPEHYDRIGFGQGGE